MLLITMHEWLGPGRKLSPEQAHKVESYMQPRSFVTALPLGAAIERIADHQRVFNTQSLLAIELTLVNVIQIDDLTSEQIIMAGAEYIESLG